MKILIATDAWYPQVNGVVNTLDNVAQCLRKLDHEVMVLACEELRSFPIPGYHEIRLKFPSQEFLSHKINEFQPDSVHIATEGPVGLSMRKWCRRNGVSYTTSFHTQFPEYIAMRVPLPGVKVFVYWMLRQFHKHSLAVFATTQSVAQRLEDNGFINVCAWTRGVDHTVFRDYGNAKGDDRTKPVMIYAGRLAIEKGIYDFLNVDIEGTKVVIGDGPLRASLERNFPDVDFKGYLFKEELAREMSAGDVFVFPSRTDTFGLVMIEAMACGLPVAAFPEHAPLDVIEHGVSGWVEDDMKTAITQAAKLSRQSTKTYAQQFTWAHTAQMFFDRLVPLNKALDEKGMKRTSLSQR